MTLIIGNFEPSTSVSDAEPSTAQCIGAILTMIDGLRSKVAFYCYDANGNVTDLVGTNGQFLAQYQFDPYGNTISKTGALADVNPFRFSTKYLDSETGLYYYGHRYYSPGMGRWCSRDPIEEEGFRIMRHESQLARQTSYYLAMLNSPIGAVDALGLLEFSGCTEDQKRRIADAFHNSCNMPNVPRFGRCLCNDRLNNCLQNQCSSNKKFVCQKQNAWPCDQGDCAGTYPWPFDDTIFICQKAFDYNKCRFLSCTVIHELTHNCQHIFGNERWPERAERCMNPRCR